MVTNNESERIASAADTGAAAPVDPTRNVLDHVRAAVARLDDLRQADSRRIDELRIAEARRMDELADLRAVYEERLRDAEAKRIDAIRAVDVNAVAVASQRAADQATVLANQVVQSAEALRTLVASTANTVATSQQQLATTLSARLTTLEQANYEGAGRAKVTDPALAELVSEMKSLRQSRDQSGGERRGMGLSANVLVAGVGFILTLLTIGGIVFAVLSNRGTP